jgi:hypothetical protein
MNPKLKIKEWGQIKKKVKNQNYGSKHEIEKKSDKRNRNQK